MTVQEALEIRERAKALGLESCCDECREAIERLDKLGKTSDWTITRGAKNHTATIGLGQEDAVRWLRRQIGATSVVS